MNDDNMLGPPNPELQGLFEAEAEFPEMPLGSRNRVRDALQSAIAILPPIGGGGGGMDPSGMDPSGLGDAAGAAGSAAAGGSGAAGVAAAAGLSGAKAIVVAAAIYAAGVASGAGIQSALTPEQSEPSAVVATAAVEVPPEAPTVTPVEPPALEVAPPPAREPRRASRHSAHDEVPVATAEVPRSSRIDAERAIIDVARAAIAHNHVGSALAAVRRHRREFPRGELQEEREGLWIIALARGGRRDEAQRRSARFHRRFPRSALRRAIDLALEE